MDSMTEIHDKLLAEKPDDVEHDAANCAVCNETTNTTNPSRGGDMNTYTEDELTSAVKEALAPVQAELDTLRNSLAEGEVEERISAARAEVEAQIAELQASLDAAEIRATEAERTRDEIVAWLDAEAAAVEEAAALEARKEERKSVVSAASLFSEAHIEANLDRWVAMDDETFGQLVEGWKELSTAARSTEVPTGLPAETAMSTRTTNNNGGSAVAEVHAALRSGFDPRAL
jgi:hypothetical protein